MTTGLGVAASKTLWHDGINCLLNAAVQYIKVYGVCGKMDNKTYVCNCSTIPYITDPLLMRFYTYNKDYFQELGIWHDEYHAYVVATAQSKNDSTML